MSSSVESVGQGRVFLEALYTALRLIRENPAGTSTVRKALDRLSAACEPLLDPVGELRLRVVRQSLYLYEERLESDIENFVFYGHVHGTLEGAGIGVIVLNGIPSRADWNTFLALVVRISGPQDDPTKIARLRKAMASRSVRHIEVEPPLAGGADFPGELERRTAAKRTYVESVAISKELFNGTRMGRSANVKQVKQAVQNIVEGVLHNEASLGGLSILR